VPAVQQTQVAKTVLPKDSDEEEGEDYEDDDFDDDEEENFKVSLFFSCLKHESKIRRSNSFFL